MTNVLRLAIVDPSDAARDALKSMLLGLEMVWLEAECSRYEFFSDVVAQTHPDIGIVALDADPDKALKLVEQLAATSPRCSILVVSGSTDGSLILRAMRAGAKEFLPKPVKIEDLVGALERLSERQFGKGEGKVRGSQVIAICGATGGVGTTSLAVNLGCVAGGRSEELRLPRRSRLGSGRCRRLPRCNSRLHTGRRRAKRNAARLHAVETIADEAFVRPVPAAAARATVGSRAW